MGNSSSTDAISNKTAVVSTSNQQVDQTAQDAKFSDEPLYVLYGR